MTGEKPPTIFISYAHESEALRSSVKALADWLEERGCRVAAAGVGIPISSSCSISARGFGRYGWDMHRLAERLLRHVGRFGVSLRIVNHGSTGPRSDWLAIKTAKARSRRSMPAWRGHCGAMRMWRPCTPPASDRKRRRGTCAILPSG